PGILRIFQQPRLETFFRLRHLLAHHAGQQPHAGIDQDISGDLAAREHIVADRDLLERTRLDHPLVHALEPPAYHDHALAPGYFAHARLRQRPPARREQQPRTAVACNRIERTCKHVGTHHHAGTATRGRVVDRTMLVGSGPADIDRFAIPDAAFERA